MTHNKKKTVALILAALLCFFTLFSVFFVASESTHVCCCAKCEVCHQISFLESVAKSLDSGLVGASVILVSGFVIVYTVHILDLFFADKTPVTLKVKITD